MFSYNTPFTHKSRLLLQFGQMSLKFTCVGGLLGTISGFVQIVWQGRNLYLVLFWWHILRQCRGYATTGKHVSCTMHFILTKKYAKIAICIFTFDCNVKSGSLLKNLYSTGLIYLWTAYLVQLPTDPNLITITMFNANHNHCKYKLIEFCSIILPFCSVIWLQIIAYN